MPRVRFPLRESNRERPCALNSLRVMLSRYSLRGRKFRRGLRRTARISRYLHTFTGHLTTRYMSHSPRAGGSHNTYGYAHKHSTHIVIGLSDSDIHKTLLCGKAMWSVDPTGQQPRIRAARPPAHTRVSMWRNIDVAFTKLSSATWSGCRWPSASSHCSSLVVSVPRWCSANAFAARSTLVTRER